KEPTTAGTPAPRLRGLCAVDLRSGFFPRVVRCEAELGGHVGELAVVGGRLYQSIQPSCDRDEGCRDGEPFTIVGHAQAFARGHAWQLATTPHRVDRWAVGDAQTLWTTGHDGSLQSLDVASPAAIEVVKRYPRTWTSRL